MAVDAWQQHGVGSKQIANRPRSPGTSVARSMPVHRQRVVGEKLRGQEESKEVK